MRGYHGGFVLSVHLTSVLSKSKVSRGFPDEPLEETVLGCPGPRLEVVHTDALLTLVLVRQGRGQGHRGEAVPLPSRRPVSGILLPPKSFLFAVSLVDLFANDCLFWFWWDNWFIITYSRFNCIDYFIIR